MRAEHVLVIALAGCFTPASRPRLARPELDTHVPAAPPVNAADWRLDVRSAIAYAFDHSPLLSERAQLESIASAKIGAARQLTNPEIRIGRSTDDTLLGPTDRLSIALRLHPDAPWSIDAKVAQARAGLEAERATTAGARRAIAARIHKLYARLAFAQASIDLLDREHDVIGSRKRTLEEQMAHAAATRLDVALAAQDLVEIAATKANLEIAGLGYRTEIASLAGIPAGQTWTPTWELTALRALRTGLDPRALMQRALAGRPDLVAAAAHAEAADAVIYDEKTQRIPWIDTLAVERSGRDTREWAVAATISVPLFSLNSGKIAVATATHSRFLGLRDRLVEQTRREVDHAVALVEATGRRARVLQDGFDVTNKEIELLLAQAKSSTTADPIKLLQLAERQIRGHRTILDAILAHRLALIELDELVGGAS